MKTNGSEKCPHPQYNARQGDWFRQRANKGVGEEDAALLGRAARLRLGCEAQLAGNALPNIAAMTADAALPREIESRIGPRPQQR